jgi:tRNA(fMet)-specific endonuclease VapC
MIRFLLDTDHVSLQERGHLPLLTRLRVQPPEALSVSIVTVQESVRGRLALLSRQLPSDQLLLAYAKLQQTVQFFSTVHVLAFDRRCLEQYDALRSQGVRIGTLDLRIAATALVHKLTMVTRNTKDFARVPGLQIEDWAEG